MSKKLFYRFNNEEYFESGVSNLATTSDEKKILFLSELGHMIYLYSENPIQIVQNPAGEWG